MAEQPVNLSTVLYLGVFSRAERRSPASHLQGNCGTWQMCRYPRNTCPRTRTRASQPRATRAIRSGLKTEPRQNHSHQSHGPCEYHGADDVVRNASGETGVRTLPALLVLAVSGTTAGADTAVMRPPSAGAEQIMDAKQVMRLAAIVRSTGYACPGDLRSLQASARGGRAAIRGYVLGQRRTRRPAHASGYRAPNSRRCNPRGGVKTVILQEIKIRLRAIGAAAKGYPCALIRCVKNI